MFLDGDHGDFSCSGSVCTIDANAIALGTDTIGDYGSDVTSNQGLVKTGTEAATLGLISYTDGQILQNSAVPVGPVLILVREAARLVWIFQ